MVNETSKRDEISKTSRIKDAKIISFDLDGTLVDMNFDDIIWQKEIPSSFAKKNNVSFEEARKIVFSEYYKALFIEKTRRWTDVEFWFERFDLGSVEDMLREAEKHVIIYEDTLEILKYLKEKYKLIIISNAHLKFIDVKLRREGLRDYFDKIISAPEELGMNKNKSIFLTVADLLGVKPSEMVHVGDSIQSDFDAATIAGLNAILIDRSGDHEGNNIIHSLLDLKRIL